MLGARAVQGGKGRFSSQVPHGSFDTGWIGWAPIPRALRLTGWDRSLQHYDSQKESFPASYQASIRDDDLQPQILKWHPIPVQC